MTTEEKLDRLTFVVASHDQQIEHILGATQNLLEAARRHDDQIGELIKVSEQNAREWQQLRKEFQAYLNTLPKN